ncbi:Tn3 family transposase [Streptomyces sp. NPDC093937]|uniref:Tn3 family transposase n=2 Tax=unclassified Streptomyces TaxID=2593676 RepID=UPI0034259727
MTRAQAAGSEPRRAADECVESPGDLRRGEAIDASSMIGSYTERFTVPNFDLLPRIKRINKVKLSRPVAGDPDAYPQLTPALTRPIRWELIAQQYDQMIKSETAIRTRTASTEAILRRSPATPPTPPTRRCWRSAAPKRRSSWPATCGCATSSGRSRRA